MNCSGGCASGSGGAGLTGFFYGTASAEWASSNSGNGSMNNGRSQPLVLPTTGTDPCSVPGTGGGVLGGILGGVYLTSNTKGHLAAEAVVGLAVSFLQAVVVSTSN